MSADTPATRGDLARMESHIKDVMNEKDRRYEQRFVDSQTAVGAALQAADKAVSAAMTAAKEAVQKAEMASEKRFEGVNEFRGAMNDQQQKFIPRIESEFRANALELRLDALEKVNIAGRGQRLGMAQLWGYIAAVVGVLLALLSYARHP
jgi:hypothetical protein